MNNEEVREKCLSKLKTRQQAAKEIGIDYVNFTRFLNGKNLGAESMSKIENWIKENAN